MGQTNLGMMYIVRYCKLDAQLLVAKKTTTIHSHHASSGFQTRVAGPFLLLQSTHTHTHTHIGPQLLAFFLLLLKHQSKEELSYG
jgi:hypothetical protein